MAEVYSITTHEDTWLENGRGPRESTNGDLHRHAGQEIITSATEETEKLEVKSEIITP